MMRLCEYRYPLFKPPKTASGVPDFRHPTLVTRWNTRATMQGRLKPSRLAPQPLPELPSGW
jgi:hypothetical protein